MSEKVISIFGTSRAKPGDDIYRLALELGKELAAAGFTIANGGYGGTMEAAAHGASLNSGKVIGITCSAFKRGKANQYVSEEIRTESLQERLGELISIGDGYVILPGGTGTLLELAEVWELKNKHFIGDGKQIILLGSFWQPVVKLIAVDDPRSTECISFADTVSEAVEMLKKIQI